MKEIEFKLGMDLEQCVDQLKNEKVPCYGVFNGHTLYSYETVDTLYLRVTGKTKKGHDLAVKEHFAAMDREREEHKKRSQS